MCSACGHVMDRSANFTGNDAPNEGDLCLCIACAAFYVRETNAWRQMTPQEFGALHPDNCAEMLRLRATILRSVYKVSRAPRSWS